MDRIGLVVLVVGLAGVPDATPETLTAAADAQASVNRPELRFGRASAMGVRRGAGGNVLTSYARFDLSSLPKDAAVPRAVLRVWVRGVVTPGTIEVLPALAPWQEETLAADARIELGAPVAMFAVGTGQVGRAVEVDVTRLVQDWAGGLLENYGLALRADDSSAIDALFDTRESGRAPELEIAGGDASLAPQPLNPRVPTGTIWLFDLTACPPEWSEMALARGRALVGLPFGGTPLGNVGVGLPNVGLRTITSVPSHTHTTTVGAESAHTHPVTVNAESGHTHILNPGSIATTSAGAHTHAMSSDGAHSHSIPSNVGPASQDAVDWFNNTANASTNQLSTDTAGAHDHVIASAGSHSHTVDLPSMTVGSGSPHTHTATAGAGSSHTHTVTVNATGSATVDVTMPYIQFLVCRKN